MNEQTIPRPGEPPHSQPWLATSEQLEEWTAYVRQSDQYWKELARLVGLQVPCQGLEYIGGGDVLLVLYEDKSYAWLGGWVKANEHDGPYAFGPADTVGGHRYPGGEDEDGSRFTPLHMVEVEDPDDIQSVANALVRAARELADLPISESY